MGYCGGCADIVHDRERVRNVAKYPFAVVDRVGEELEVFDTESEAEDYAYRLRGARAEKRTP